MAEKLRDLGEEVVFGIYKCTVHTLRVRDSAKVERLRRDAARIEDPDAKSMAENVYPALAACSIGTIPTLDEFLDMSAVEAGIWFTAVEHMNPGLLPTAEVTEEKKDS